MQLSIFSNIFSFQNLTKFSTAFAYFFPGKFSQLFYFFEIETVSNLEHLSICLEGAGARQLNEPFASSVAMLMKPPTAAVGHHKTDPMWNFYQQNFKKFQKLFHTAQTRIGRILATVVRSSMGRGWIYAFWMCWNRIPLDTLGAQCCGKWSMPDGRMCERNRWEGRYFLTIGKWPTIINVRMLCGIKLLKQGDYGVGCAGGVCVCVRGNVSDMWVCADTKETDGKQMIMTGYDNCSGAATCLWIYNRVLHAILFVLWANSFQYDVKAYGGIFISYFIYYHLIVYFKGNQSNPPACQTSAISRHSYSSIRS